jgi:hypothetical protein
VTCLRSPSSAAFEVRILSARCFGVFDSGLAKRVGSDATAKTRSPDYRAELGRGWEFTATHGAGQRKPRSALQAELRIRRVFVRALWTLHQRLRLKEMSGAPAASFNDPYRRGGTRISGSNATVRCLLHRNASTPGSGIRGRLEGPSGASGYPQNPMSHSHSVHITFCKCSGPVLGQTQRPCCRHGPCSH